MEHCDTMGERIGRIWQIRTDFGDALHGFQAKKAKKIRFNLPNPPNPFFHCITLKIRDDSCYGM
jgi:hypothetical protein